MQDTSSLRVHLLESCMTPWSTVVEATSQQLANPNINALMLAVPDQYLTDRSSTNLAHAGIPDTPDECCRCVRLTLILDQKPFES